MSTTSTPSVVTSDPTSDSVQTTGLSSSPTLPAKRANPDDLSSELAIRPDGDSTSSLRSSISEQTINPSSKRIKYESELNRRKQLLDFFETAYRRRRDLYLDHVLELFFLEQQGNLMDFYAWRKRAPTLPLLHYLRTVAKEDSKEFEQLQLDKARLDSIGPSSVKVVSLSQLSVTLPVLPPTPGTTSAALGSSSSSSNLPSSSSTSTTTTSSITPNSSSAVQLTASSTISSSSSTATLITSTSTHASATPIITTAASSSRTSTLVGATSRLESVSVSPIGASGVLKSSSSSISHAGSANISSSLALSTSTTSTPTASTKHVNSSQLRPSSNAGARGSSAHSLSTSSNALFSKLSAPIASKLGAHRHANSSSFGNGRGSISSVYEKSIGSQEQIAERAKQEAHVMQRVAELRKEGLWSSKRLPKVQEPSREKAHWDYLLEEMEWLATDFAQERKWKKAAAKKCSRMIVRFHQDKQQQVEKAEREEQQRLRKIASTIAKEIRSFWNNVEKLVEFKMQTRLEEKRKKALDIHLNFIVDQTEKFSSWLTEGMNKSELTTANNSLDSSPMLCSNSAADDEFKPHSDEEDDEETIAKEEEEIGLVSEQNELELLQQESEMPIDQLLKSLPSSLDEAIGNVLPSSSASNVLVKDDDVDFITKSDEEMEDEEDTIAEQEQVEADVDHEAELRALEDEAEMPVEKLLEMYSGAFDEPSDAEDEDDDATESAETTEAASVSDDSSDETEDEEDVNEMDDKETQPEIGVEFLINPDGQQTEKTDKDGPSIEITDIAAGAELIQPKGNTLSTVQVSTKVPSLLKGSLREYQHIGLDWLVAMYEKKLNGILADEMGLGKTIQTISLLAHLACEKGIWGPHLIVVPTSVMLNWEMEFKKWCPGFKIITYYGNPKERKLKRKGWTKPNQFHVCITSYKLVIQDHASFRRKKWVYFILDEAQHIKNFKSQRWQMLLNFNTSRRLLLTGTPLQNNLMELWSLMHFLMPNVFSSHRDFKDWFVNPVTGMIEGNHEFNEGLIRRLHKVLRPFLLRRIKADVEQQMPKKYEHVVSCRLSKRQRFLYEEFMGLTKTKDTLQSGNFLSVINVLMQLRKVCNHPNLFEERPVTSPLLLPSLSYRTASLVTKPLDNSPVEEFNYDLYNFRFIDYSSNLSAFAAHRIKKFQTPSKMFEQAQHDCQIDSDEFPPPIPKNVIHLKVTTNHRTNNHPIQLAQNNLSSRSSSRLQTASLTPSRLSPRIALKDLDSKQLITSNGESEDANKAKPVSLEDDKQLLEELKSTIKPINSDSTLLIKDEPVEKSEIAQLRADQLKERLERLSRLNGLRCTRFALYGSDLIDVSNLQRHPKYLTAAPTLLEPSFNKGRGHFDCLFHLDQQISSRKDWQINSLLRRMLKTCAERAEEMNPILERFVFLTPRVAAPAIQMHVSHPCPSKKLAQQTFENTIRTQFAPCSSILHRVVSNMSTHFPELRLIQYDCGKLQTLDRLLWNLKAENHRVLIFTQMSRMLDIFEQFLNYHGHTYLRLDGTTRIEQRQALMERFNADKRIFCFILSTRSGGVGVNLTGADTVIFYDSDWNPTMDAQAQDRCHRIGQTRDVHIYRLISEKTIEENILKKARQKKFLGDVAIEGGNFTTAFFRNDSIRELFNVNDKRDDSPLEEVRELGARDEESNESKVGKLDLQLGQALQTAEEDTDVAAAKIASAEADAELAEFDENIPIENADRLEEKSPEEEELERLVYQLTPIEKYAMVFLETIQEPFQTEQLKQAEEEIEAQKKEWELEHLKSLKEEEERAASQSEPDDMLTIWNEDVSQMFLFSDDLLPMPVWAPPTPPQNENDLYIDYSIGLLYDSQIIPESQLPPVYIPKEPKRARVELPIVSTPALLPPPTSAAMTPSTTPARPARPPKVRKEEHLNVPRSLFDRPSPSLVKLRRELKTLKTRGQLSGGPDIVQLQKIVASLGPNCNLSQPPTLQQQAALSKSPFFILHGTQQENQIPWCINEDWILLDVIQHLQELPVNLLVLTPAHIPNWDLVADVLNARTSTYRSPKLCRHHYESVILQREEGKLAELPKKVKKPSSKQLPANGSSQPNPSTNLSTPTPVTSNLFNNQNSSKLEKSSPIATSNPISSNSVSSNASSASSPQPKPIRTSFLYHQDNNQSFTQLCASRFDNIKQLAAKRTPTLKPIFINQTGQNPKHLALLQENNIQIEQPLTPMMVAANRAERIAREKAKNQQLLEQQQLARQKQAQLVQLQKQQQQQQQQVLSTTPIKAGVHPTANVISGTNIQNQRANAIGAQFAKVSALPTAQLTLPKSATVQQLIATGSNAAGQAQSTSGPTLSISANQQVSNLAKALSQAAANFQAQQNSANSQQQTIQLHQTPSGSIARLTPNASNTGTTISVNASASGLPKLIAQSPVSISASTISSQSPAGSTAVLSVSGVQTPQKIIAATLTNTPISAGKLTQAQLQAYKQQLILRQQQQQQQITLQKHTVQTANQSPNASAQSSNSSTTSTIQIQGTNQLTATNSTTQQVTQLAPLQIQQIPASSNVSATVVGTPTGAMIVSTAPVPSNVTLASSNAGTTRLQIASGQLIHQPQPGQSTTTVVKQGQPTLVSTGTGSQMVSISTAGGQQLMTATGQIIQRATSGNAQAAVLSGQPSGSPVRVPVSIAGSTSAHVLSGAKVMATNTTMSVTGAAGSSLPLAVPISAGQTQRIFTTGVGNKPQQIIARTATEAELAQLLGNRANVAQRVSTSISGSGAVGQGTTTVAVTGHPIVTASGKQIQLPAGLTQVQLLHIQPPGANTPATVQVSSQSVSSQSIVPQSVASNQTSNATQLVAVSSAGTVQTVSTTNATFTTSQPATVVVSTSSVSSTQASISNVSPGASIGSTPSSSTGINQSNPQQLQLQAAPVATLVKTVGTPASIAAPVSGSQTLAIPMSAVTMAGVNLLTSQMSKDASGAAPGTTYLIYAPKGNSK